MKLAPLEELILRLFQFLNGDRACLDILLSGILDESKDGRECSSYLRKCRAVFQ